MYSQDPISPDYSGSALRQENLKYLRKIYFRILYNWYFILLFLLLTLALAFFYCFFSVPTYRISTTILINEKKERILGSKNQILEGFSLGEVIQNLDNQITVLKSRTLLRKTLDELPYQIECYNRRLFSKVSLYPDNPIIIRPVNRDSVPHNIEFSFMLLEDNTFSIRAKFPSVSKSGKPFVLKTNSYFGDTINTPHGNFTIYIKQDKWPSEDLGRKLCFIFYSEDKMIEDYSKRLKVEAASRTGTTVILSLEGTNKEKEIEFLRKLTEIFLNNSLDKKNQEANRTIQFIDDQLIGISDSLVLTENQLQQFRSQNKVMNLSVQSQSIIEQAMNLENEKARLGIETNYYNYLADYISKDNAGQAPIAPATMGITDPGLTKLVADLSELQAQYYSRRLGEKNPLQSQLAQRVSNIKEALRETLDGIIRANSIAINENQEQIRAINARASALPVTERQLLGIERKYKLNDELYTFLLEKRADAQIQKASNTPDNELVDPAEAAFKPVKPKKLLAYTLAVILGIGIPVFWIMITDLFNNKITEEEDLRKITDLSVYSQISRSNLKTSNTLIEDQYSHTAEGFRSLRNRLQLLTRDINSPVILITSSMPSEGKSFVAFNLASAWSLTGKKTVLVDFDLRNNDKEITDGCNGNQGISTWLSGKHQLTDIMNQTPYENLTIISSGPFTSNISELVVSERTKELFILLKERFDCIIVDTSPMNLLSDAIHLATYADISVLIVRQNITRKNFLENSIREFKISNIHNAGLVLNDVQLKDKRFKYGSKYGFS
jgi:capsular exopolysaccharide synthesis family protein